MGARRLTGAKGEGGRGYGSQSGTRQSLVRYLPICLENGTGKVEGAEDQYPRIGGYCRERLRHILLRVRSESELGRGVAGESFDKYGYAFVFRWTAAAGLVAVLFVLLEWARVSTRERREKARADTAPTVEPAQA